MSLDFQIEAGLVSLKRRFPDMDWSKEGLPATWEKLLFENSSKKIRRVSDNIKRVTWMLMLKYDYIPSREAVHVLAKMGLSSLYPLFYAKCPGYFTMNIWMHYDKYSNLNISRGLERLKELGLKVDEKRLAMDSLQVIQYTPARSVEVLVYFVNLIPRNDWSCKDLDAFHYGKKTIMSFILGEGRTNSLCLIRPRLMMWLRCHEYFPRRREFAGYLLLEYCFYQCDDSLLPIILQEYPVGVVLMFIVDHVPLSHHSGIRWLIEQLPRGYAAKCVPDFTKIWYMRHVAGLVAQVGHSSFENTVKRDVSYLERLNAMVEFTWELYLMRVIPGVTYNLYMSPIMEMPRVYFGKVKSILSFIPYFVPPESRPSIKVSRSLLYLVGWATSKYEFTIPVELWKMLALFFDPIPIGREDPSQLFRI